MLALKGDGLRVDDLFAFARERHAIWKRKEQERPKPWTEDPILQTYKFCNIYRELDKVTIWIRDHWRTSHKEEPHLWFSMLVARFINVPEVLGEVGYPATWSAYKRKVFVEVMKDRKQRGLQNFSGAYMVRSDPGCKIDYVVSVFDAMWAERKRIEALLNTTTSLQRMCEELVPFRGMGSFMAGQVIADLKYTPSLSMAPDWWTWACSGPGSRRGLSRVCGQALPIAGSTIPNWKESEWLETLQLLQVKIKPLFARAGLSLPHAQDLQGMLCEFDKYERVRLNQGRPRSLYPGI